MRTAAASSFSHPPREPELAEYLTSLGPDVLGWRAVCLAVSTLKPAVRRAQKLKHAEESFRLLLTDYQGRLFHLTNADIVVITTAPADELHETARRVAELLGGASAKSALRAFELAEVTGSLHEACIGPAADAHPSGPGYGDAGKPQAARIASRPIQPSDLVRVETALGRADVAGLLRRQTVCQLIEGERPKPVFRELYTSIADLEEKVVPGVKLAADRWLFQHLTRALDARVLTQLVETPEPSLASHISLNLNIASLQSRQFLAFDKMLKPEARKTIVLELQLIDILADMNAFQFARDFVHERGYSLCLDGLTYLTAPLTDRTLLGLDLVKVIWTPEMATDEVESRRNAFAWMIDKAGDGRAILCRCDGEDAIRFGQSIGITLFQGMAVDTRAEAAQAVFAEGL